MELTTDQRQKIIDKGNILLDNTLFADFYCMEDAEIGYLMRSIGKYVGQGEIPSFNDNQRVVKMAFNRFRVSHDANSRKYLNTCETNKKIALEREEKKRNANNRK